MLISIQIRLSRLWRKTPFFIQGQMDIHPGSPWYNADFMALTGRFYPLLSRGGIIVAHDYNAWIGSRKAVDEFCAETGIIPIPMPDKSGSCVILKSY